MNLEILLETKKYDIIEKCLVGKMLEELPEPYKSAVTKQLTTSWKDGGESDYDMSSKFSAAGFKISPSTVNRHRTTKCNCGKGGN